MSMDEKNKLIEEYITNIVNQVNMKYNGIIDDERIKQAIEFFKDSPEDLETEIIPTINGAIQESIANDIKRNNYKQYSIIKIVADSIGDITEEEIKNFMVKHYDLLQEENSESIVNLVISEYSGKRKTDIPVDHDIPILIQNVLNSTETKELLKGILSNVSTIGEHDNTVLDGMLFAHNIVRNDYTLEFISQYLIIHREAYDLEGLYQQIKDANICEMNETQVQQFYSKLLLSSIAKRFNIENVDSLESKQQIYSFIYQNYIENGYCFQGLNSKYKDSVIKNGLSSKFSRENVSTLEEIDRIFEKHGLDKIFYSKLNETSLAPYYYTTDSMAIAYHYSYHNPEWFAYFVAAGNDMSDADYDKTAFYRRDYDACKNNLAKLCNQYHLSSDETKTIIDNFNSFWTDIVSEDNYGTVTFVQRNLINRDRVNFNIENLEDVDVLSMISKLLKSNNSIDIQYIDIPPEKIDVINVPSLTEFYDKEKIASSSKRKFIRLENGEKYYYDILIHADKTNFTCASISEDGSLTNEIKNSAYGIPIEIIRCNDNMEKDIIDYQNLDMMIAVNGIANSDEGKKLIERARSKYSPEYMKNYYYHLSQMYCDIASDENYSIQERASALTKMAKEIYPKAYIMDKTNDYPQYINADKKVFTYLNYKQRMLFNEIGKMEKGENSNPIIIEELSAVFREKLEGKIDKSFTPEFRKQISMMSKQQPNPITQEIQSEIPQKTVDKIKQEMNNSKASDLNDMLNDNSPSPQKQVSREKTQPKVLTINKPSSPGNAPSGFVGGLSLIAIIGMMITIIIGLLTIVNLLN